MVDSIENTEILENAIIIYSNGKKELFRAIKLTKEGIITGRIRDNGEFINGGFIAKTNIKTIKTVPNNENY